MHARKNGYILLTSLVFMSVLMMVSAGIVNYATSYARAEHATMSAAQALAIAEAGIDKAAYELNRNASYSGEIGTAIPGGTFTVSLSTIDSNTKRITSVGYVPNATNPTATRTVKATIGVNTTIVSFRYGAQVGEGGVVMNNGSQIIGNLFSNGDVSGSGTITGDVTVSVSTSPTANQEWSAQNSSFNLGDTSAHANVAQSFTPSGTGSLANVTLYLKKTGAPGDISVKIVTDNSGKPSKTVLASGAIPASVITSSYGFVTASLDSSPALNDGQKYWIIAIAPVSSSNYFIWGLDSSSGYSSGGGAYSSNWNASNPSWSNVSGDLDFQAFMTGALTSLSGVSVGGNAYAHTLSSCSVGKDAYYQSISGCSVSGTSHPGATDQTPVPFAISSSQIANWEAAAAANTLSGNQTITNNASQTLGPVKINGNLNVSNGATLTLAGPVWVNGNVSFSNNATITVASGLGNSGAVLIADATGNTGYAGTIELSNNVTITGNGNAGSFPMIISTNTGNEAIELSNNGASVIVFAPYGGIVVNNNAGANQISAYKLTLNNNSTITYVSGLQSVNFSSGQGGSWTVQPGSYVILH